MFSFSHCGAFYRAAARAFPVVYNTQLREGFRQRAMLYDWISSDNYNPPLDAHRVNMLPLSLRLIHLCHEVVYP